MGFGGGSSHGQSTVHLKYILITLDISFRVFKTPSPFHHHHKGKFRISLIKYIDQCGASTSRGKRRKANQITNFKCTQEKEVQIKLFSKIHTYTYWNLHAKRLKQFVYPRTCMEGYIKGNSAMLLDIINRTAGSL